MDKNDLVLDQCGNVTLSMRKVVRRRTASFSTTGPSSFRPITSNCLRGGTERIRKLNQNLWPTNYMSNDSTSNNNWKVNETFKEDIRSLLLQLGDVELGDGESLFRVHDVLPLKICCRLLETGSSTTILYLWCRKGKFFMSWQIWRREERRN